MRFKWIKAIFIIILMVSLTGCNSIDINNMMELKAPQNKDLIILGRWQVKDYKVLDKNMYSLGDVDDIEDKYIDIGEHNINIDTKMYDGVKYKLKVVKDDYVISYQNNFIVRDLGVNNSELNVISASDKNNNIFEFFYVNKDESFIYYQGVLLNVKWISNVSEDAFNAKNIPDIKSVNYNDYNTDKGLYITFREPRKLKEDGTYTDEKYRTLWISAKKDKVQPIESVNGIIFPRKSGIWTLSKNSIDSNGYHKEYFVANAIDKKSQITIEDKEKKFINEKSNVYRGLNYIGDNYISTEIYTGNNFENKYTQYEMIPLDNLFSDKSLVFQDIFSKKYNVNYNKDYTNAYHKLTKDQQEKVKKYIDYSNFGVVRENGNWRMEGRISPSSLDGDKYDYKISIQPPVNLVRYDSLLIPWKILKNDIPLIKDAYTSPDGKLAIVILDDKLIVFNTSNNKLSTPVKEFKLKKGEKVIMAQWCEGDYVDYWGNTFNEYQKQVNKTGK